MFCIIYRSIQNPLIGNTEIQEFLEASKEYNRTHNITGCLLSYNNEFVQYLEGEKSSVERLFNKIEQDWRHQDIVVLVSGHINDREFEDWSMAYENFLGPNFRLEYLKLLVSSYFENDTAYRHLSPETKRFWLVAKTMLSTQSVERFR